MKFDFVIGNPPYQEMYEGESTGANSIYDSFMTSAFAVSDRVELITPARFLFNAGSTPKAWNEQMLNDPHFKVLLFEHDSSKIFRNVDIKGGVAITYRDANANFGAIETFTPYEELNAIFHKVVRTEDFVSLSTVMVTSFAYHFTAKMHGDYPEAAEQMSKGHANDLKSSVFVRLPQIFFDEKPDDGNEYARILGRENNERVYKYIRRDYINDVVNFASYKVFLPKANGIGEFGEILASPIIGLPNDGSTETFLSVGKFETKQEADNALAYIKTKFARALLGVLKVTQDITPSKWQYVPLQDFSSNAEIDWSKSICDIDQQLYKKYNLDDKESEFIEKYVKEME